MPRRTADRAALGARVYAGPEGEFGAGFVTATPDADHFGAVESVGRRLIGHVLDPA